MKAQIVDSKFLKIDLWVNKQRIRATIPLKEIAKTYVSRSGMAQVGSKGAITLRDFAKLYEELHSSQKRALTEKRQKQSNKNLIKRLGDMFLHEIQEETVEKYRNVRKEDKNLVTCKNIRPATINRETTQLKHMMKMARKWQYLLSNPLSELKKLPEFNEQDRWLTSDELAKFLSCLKGWMKDFLELLAWTGLRLGELRELKWENVEFTSPGCIRTETEKQQRRIKRDIYLRSRSRQILLRLHANTSDTNGYVFPSSTKKPRREALVEANFRNALARSGLKHFTIHDLRRTFAVHHAIAYKDPFMLRDELGHSDFRTLHRYVRFSRIYDAKHSIFKDDCNIVFGEKFLSEVLA